MIRLVHYLNLSLNKSLFLVPDKKERKGRKIKNDTLRNPGKILLRDIPSFILNKPLRTRKTLAAVFFS